MPEIIARMRQKIGTTAEWVSANPILTLSEIGIEQLPGGAFRAKLGDGITTFDNLNFTFMTAVRAVLPITASQDLEGGDVGKEHDVVSVPDVTISIRTNASHAIDVGAKIVLWQRGVGKVIVSADLGVSLNGSAQGSISTIRGHSAITLLKVDTDVWIAEAGVVGWESMNVVSINTVISPETSDFQCDAGTHTLPTGVLGKSLFLKNRFSAGGNATFNAVGPDTVDGAASIILAPNESARLSFNGFEWAALVLSGSAGSFSDAVFNVFDNVDPTKILMLQAGNITTGTTRTLSAPDADGIILLEDATQDIENKTIGNNNVFSVRSVDFLLEKTGDPSARAFFNLGNLSSGFDRDYILPDGGGDVVLRQTAQTISNKTFDTSNIYSLPDIFSTFSYNADSTAKMIFDLQNITAATTRVLTVPDSNGTLMLTSLSAVNNAVLVSDANGQAKINTGLLWDGSDLGLTGNLDVTGVTSLGDGGATDYSSFATDGELALFGTARVKRSLVIGNDALGTGTTPPTQVILGNYSGWEYDISDDSVVSFHMPEDWDPSTDIDIRIDWYIDEAFATASAEVQYQVDYSAVPYDASEAIDSPTHSGSLTTGDINIPATAKSLTKSSVTIPAASLAVNDQVGLTLSRIALIAGTDPTAKPSAINLHMIYTSNKLGEPT